MLQYMVLLLRKFSTSALLEGRSISLEENKKYSPSCLSCSVLRARNDLWGDAVVSRSRGGIRALFM